MGDAAERQKQPTHHLLAMDVPVAVRCCFEGSCSPGFETAEIVVAPDGVVGYRLRRLSDGMVFPVEDVIPASR